MKIENVIIKNWIPPGEQWWAEVKSKPEQPLIRANIDMVLSWQEYKELLNRDENNQP